MEYPFVARATWPCKLRGRFAQALSDRVQLSVKLVRSSHVFIYCRSEDRSCGDCAFPLLGEGEGMTGGFVFVEANQPWCSQCRLNVSEGAPGTCHPEKDAERDRTTVTPLAEWGRHEELRPR